MQVSHNPHEVIDKVAVQPRRGCDEHVVILSFAQLF